MPTQVKLGDITADVVLKDIRNVHLSVHPPTGKVRIAAPTRMSLDTIRVFAISKLGWIRKQQTKLRDQERESPREYLDRESHYVWGRRYLLKVIEEDAPVSVQLSHSRMILSARPGWSVSKKHELLEAWYRDQLKEAVPPLIAKWQRAMGVKVERFFVQRMKTKWGSCNSSARTIRLNTDLAKKSPDCLQYIVVHELAHLIEPTHNARFIAILDRFLPKWQHCRERLNRLPVRHENWSY